MIEIGVYLVVNDCYHETKYCIDNLTSKTKEKIRLHILDNGSKDERVVEYLKELTKDNKGFLKRIEEPLNLSEAYNLILQYSYQDYCCIFPINILVNEFWCEELLSEYTMCETAGIIGIRNGFQNLELTTILHKSEEAEGTMKNVWISDNNLIEGILFFSRDKLKKIGNFYTKLDAPGYEVAEFCFRFSAHGYNNYYLLKHTCSKTDIQNEYLFPIMTQDGFEKLVHEIKVMVKTKHFSK